MVLCWLEVDRMALSGFPPTSWCSWWQHPHGRWSLKTDEDLEAKLKRCPGADTRYSEYGRTNTGEAAILDLRPVL